MSNNRHQMTAAAALERLKVGNDRFIAGNPAHPAQTPARRLDLRVNGQHPFAVVLGCADSRIPPELIFDQGLGDLFVIRVAGNVVDDLVLASIEYAAAHLNTPLILVLGHSQCGAVGATIAGKKLEGHLPALAEMIQPAVEHSALEPGDKNKNAEKANALAMTALLKTSIPVLAGLVETKQLEIRAAWYDQESGKVEYLV